MNEPIVSRETIRDQARAAADAGEHHVKANTYPPGTAAHAQFERDWHAAMKYLEAVDAF